MSDCTDAADAAPWPVTGPRIARLARQLEGARDAAARSALTEAFWAEAAHAGTPLVEELDDAPGHRAVTFLWRGHRATRRVLLLAPGIGDPDRLAGSLLHHLPGTDVWYLGYRLRADHRASYRMVADISAGPAPTDPALFQQRLLALRAHAGADPLNPDRIPARWRTAQGSVLALPEAPPQPWSARRSGIPCGTVERHTVAAGVLGVERDVWAYLPPGRDPGPERRAEAVRGTEAVRGAQPLLVLCDGDMWFGRLGLHDTLDALIADGVLPPLVVLAPDAVDPVTRRLELGGRESYASFLADEVVPWASARWSLTARPEWTVVAGQGLGGMTALYAGLTRPERFGGVVAQSPSLWWRPELVPGVPAPDAVGTPWLATLAAGLRDGLLEGREGREGREGQEEAPGAVVHFDVGLHEGALAEHSEALQAVLRARGHRVTRTVHNGGHDYACWRGFLADALVKLLGADLDVDAAKFHGGTDPAVRGCPADRDQTLPRPAAR
ncbi:enterochelin esterase [Streptomyces sp. NPDC059452]|uniref:enterochelin esterase n=1 Tax=Streptomyces sp. NPDC059452 TaxID=3346835 RepID=UPI0036D150E0